MTPKTDMWRIASNILISAAVATVVVFSFSTYRPNFGTTITTINGSDTLSSSRSVINANYASLNANKVEVSDLGASTTMPQLTTLANLSTVGTITSGTWNASKLTVPYGGTGSTTLSANQVLLGNGVGNVTTPVGWGTSGQFLTSNGGGALPSWTSGGFDQTGNYGLSGTWAFSNTVNMVGTTYIKTLNASSTVVIANISYTFPGFQNASSTVLSTDGSGHLYWTTASTTITQVTATFSAPTTAGGTGSGSATCGTGATLTGGGVSGIPGNGTNNTTGTYITTNGPSTSNAWSVTLQCNSGATCGSGTVTVYAICLNKTP